VHSTNREFCDFTSLIRNESFLIKYSKLKAGEELQLHRSNPEDIEFVENIFVLAIFKTLTVLYKYLY
jgi:hypothetical protein